MSKWRRVYSNARRWQRGHLINKYGSECYLCKREFAKLQDVTIDHWEPLGKGGTDTIENYRLAHDICNTTKKDMTPEQYINFQKGLIKYE